MPTEKTYDRIVGYLKEKLSHKQRHSLEKDMMRDVFEEEAFEGLSQLSGSDLEQDMARLQQRMNARVLPARKNQFMLYFRVAAAVVLLIGIGSLIYFVLRTPTADLITEEHKMEKPAVRSEPPPAVVQTEPENEYPVNSIPIEKENIPEQVQVTSESNVEAGEEFMSPPDEASEKKEDKEPEIAPATEPLRSKSLMKTAAAYSSPRKIYSGRVVDNTGEALPGVTVMEKGTENGTVSDMNGYFSLPLQDTNSRLALNYVGFKPVELKTDEKPKDKITMEEDLVALNEVVVVGYGTQKRSSVTGAVSTIDFNEDANQGIEQPDLTNPIPPGGSVRSFKKWVYERLDHAAYKDYPGKHRITAVLTVHANGTISDIRTKEGPPGVITADLKKIISQSSIWTAALKDNYPVDADIEIHFVITVE
jgi:hypothetical protein